RHTRFSRDWSSDVCSSDLAAHGHAHGDGPRAPAVGVDHRLNEVLPALGRGDGAVEQELLVDVARVERDELLGERGAEAVDLAQRSEERRVGKEGRATETLE